MRAPTLHQVIPALETLASRWEAKAVNPAYELFHGALKKGLEKLNKCYQKLDNATRLRHMSSPIVSQLMSDAL